MSGIEDFSQTSDAEVTDLLGAREIVFRPHPTSRARLNRRRRIIGMAGSKLGRRECA